MTARSSDLARATNRQLSIFDLPVAKGEMAVPSRDRDGPVCGSTGALPDKEECDGGPSVKVVRLADLPTYPREAVQQIEYLISNLPSERLWFTYHDIRRSFGISRATIARRLKVGLVPGVRFHQGRMLEDGAVRRLDRVQLHWLLLAVQNAPERVQHLATGAQSTTSDRVTCC